MISIVKKLFLCVSAALCVQAACAQSAPVVAVDNLAVAHEHKGWRVINASTAPIHFNLMKGDLIVRIDGRNAADTGPMLMASLFNQGYRRNVKLFIERGGFGMETLLRQIPTQDYTPVGANPFRHVASGFSAPEVEFKDIDGAPLSLEQFKGKWLLIDFVATWCPLCMETLPNVLEVAGRDHLDLLVVALNDKAEAVRSMRQSQKIGAPVANLSAMAPLPVDFGITTNNWTGQIPGLVLLQPDGDVAFIAIGGADKKQVGEAIELLTGKAEQPAN